MTQKEMLARRFDFFAAKTVRIPSAFAQCECIECHKEEYINTGVYGACEWELKAQAFDASAQILVGTHTARSNYYGCVSTGMWGFGAVDGAYTNIPSTRIAEADLVFPLSSSLTTGLVNGESISISRQNASSKTWRLFRAMVRGGSTFYPFGGGLWYAKAYQEKNLVRDYVPCYLKTDWNGIPAGTIGLYDLCGSLSSNGTPFYTNDGTGEFTKGADVV